MLEATKLKDQAVAGRSIWNRAAFLIALFLFTGLSSWLMPKALSNVFGANLPISSDLSAALILNVALILIIWRRSSQLDRQSRKVDMARELADQVSLKDYTTELFNRPAIVAVIEQKMADAEPLALISFDLDHFKKVNDLYGHGAGDELLVAIARRLVDAVPAGSICARLGGDEFAVLLEGDNAQPDEALAVTRQIQQNLEREITVTGGTAVASASFGIYAPVAHDADVADIFRRSDIAMYHAKQNGASHRIAMFDPAMEAEVHHRYRTEAEIRAGIPRGEFVPFYQPQYGIRGEELLGFEVLARWHHPSGKLVEPADFIGLAESTGLISSLSMSVMRQALSDARNWDHGLTLSVNISPIQLNDPTLDQQIMKLLIETGFPPQRLELEITESALMEDTALVLNTITSLKSLGIKISLDDFGTGYSSMTQLKNFPFDRIKIDRSFVMSMLDNDESAAIVNSIASLGASLDVPITAEGIESDEIRVHLDEMGCSEGQGWLYGRPVSKNDLLAMLPQITLHDEKAMRTANDPNGSADSDGNDEKQTSPARRAAG